MTATPNDLLTVTASARRYTSPHQRTVMLELCREAWVVSPDNTAGLVDVDYQYLHQQTGIAPLFLPFILRDLETAGAIVRTDNRPATVVGHKYWLNPTLLPLRWDPTRDATVYREPLNHPYLRERPEAA